MRAWIRSWWQLSVVTMCVAGALSIAALWIMPSVSDNLASSPVESSIVQTAVPVPPPSSAAPAPKPSVGVEVKGDETYYTVQPFDTQNKQGALTFIASKFGTSVDRLVELNHLKNPDLIFPGQRLRVK